MPVCSYIVFPLPGRMAQMLADLSELDGCSVTAADNRDVAILVTDTRDDRAEHALQEQLRRIPSIQSMAITFGQIVPEPQEDPAP